MSEYRVPNMVVVPQDMNNACWYASATMILRWRGRFRDPFAADHPAYHGSHLNLHRANNGLPWNQMVQFARELGFVPVPPLQRSPRIEELMTLLRQYGPLWADGAPLDQRGNFAGVGHVVVIGGARTRPQREVLILDPWPVRIGAAYWRSENLLPLMFVRQIGNPGLPVSILHLPG